MGLKNREQATYVKIKEGKFYLTTDKEHKNPYEELEGLIKDIYLKTDEWEGQEIEKLCLVIDDGEQHYILSFSFDSAYTTTLMGFLKNADLSQPLTLVASEKMDGEKKKRSILVKQNGKWMKQYYTKDGGEVPAMQQVTINKKKVWEKTDFLEFYRNVAKDLKESINAAGSPQKDGGKYVPTAEAVEEHVHEADDEDIQDDLPF